MAANVKQGFYRGYNLYLPGWVENSMLGVEKYAYLIGHPVEKGGLGKAGHFRKIVELLWGKNNPTKHFIWHPWAEDMNEAVHTNPWDGSIDPHTALSGCGKCVSGDTRILNPITGNQPTIKELFERKEAPIVLTLNGPRRGSIPFIKGRQKLYEVILSNGHKFKATAGHQVRTAYDYVPVESLRIGQCLLGYAAYHRKSNSEHVQSIHASGVPNSLRTIEDSLVDYPAYSCFYDAQLPPILNTCQVPSPSRAYAPERNSCISVKTDVPGKRWQRNHPCQLSYPLSSVDACCLVSQADNDLLQTPLERETLLHSYPEFQSCVQSPLKMPHRRSSLEPNPDSLRTHHSSEFCNANHFSWTDYRVSEIAVQAITTTKEEDFYDLTVPVEHHYFAEGAIHHNSGKTLFMAVFGLVNWIVAPEKTLVLCTSTDLKASRKRIWGAVVAYFDAIEDRPSNWRLVDSQGVIRLVSDTGAVDDRCGLSLLAGERKHERDSIGKIIGAHNERVFLLADELAELSPAILEAAFSNLTINPSFQIVAASNFKNRYDPFGEFAEPIEGYDSITVDTDSWQSRHGHCLRLDGLKSANLTLPKEIWPIYNRKNLEEHRKSLGENTAGFWRMCRSFEAPIGVDDALYSESDFLAGNAYGQCEWTDVPINVSSLDPAYTQGGDRCIQWFMHYGRSRAGLWTIAPYKMVILRENVTLKKRTRNFQIADQFMRNCIDEGVDPEHAALDATGAGSVLADIIWEVWSTKVLRVDFSGAPSTLLVDGTKTAKDKYDRKVSELWGVGAEFLRYGQWRGITHTLARELKARHKEEIKGPMGLKIRVETKKDMKLRLGFSPDEADSFLVGVHLCRERLGAVPGTTNSLRVQKDNSWQKSVSVANALYTDADYLEEAVAE